MNDIDIYCERMAAGLWAEPVNALTNAGFFLAAYLLWRAARRERVLTPSIALLTSLVLFIGIGSSLFHTFATGWARVLDELPILVFQLVFLWVHARRVIGWQRPAAGALVLVFLGTALYGRQFPHLLNGSLVYAPAVAVLAALGIYHYRAGKAARAHLVAAAGLLVAAVVLRTLDAPLCDRFPLGTHFLWHLLVALVIYLCVAALVAAERSAGAPGTGQPRRAASRLSTR